MLNPKGTYNAGQFFFNIEIYVKKNPPENYSEIFRDIPISHLKDL